MLEKVAVAFLLTTVTACFAVPVTEKDKNFQTVNVKDLGVLGPSIETCLIPCTSCQDNPICATDGQTYGCPDALNCYKMCGQKIDVAYYGECKEDGSASPPEEAGKFKEEDPLAPPKDTSKFVKTEKKL